MARIPARIRAAYVSGFKWPNCAGGMNPITSAATDETAPRPEHPICLLPTVSWWIPVERLRGVEGQATFYKHPARGRIPREAALHASFAIYRAHPAESVLLAAESGS